MNGRAFAVVMGIITVFILVTMLFEPAVQRLSADQVTCIDNNDKVHQVYATRVERQRLGGFKAWYGDELVGDFTGMRCARISPEYRE